MTAPARFDALIAERFDAFLADQKVIAEQYALFEPAVQKLVRAWWYNGYIEGAIDHTLQASDLMRKNAA